MTDECRSLIDPNRDCLGEFDLPGPRAINEDEVLFKSRVLYLKIVI